MRIRDLLICHTGKDGGPESKVHGYWLIRAKSLFTVAVLRFDEGSREAYHSHAFNSISWVLRGKLVEYLATADGSSAAVRVHHPGMRAIHTTRDTLHKVYGRAPRTWVLTFRGPWADTWRELVDGQVITLTHDRVVVDAPG